MNRLPAFTLLACLLWSIASRAAERPDQRAFPVRRVVVLGDSITDGHTYPLLVGQALRAAGIAPPVFLNAGVGGDTAAGMLARLDRDVLPLKPELVILMAGLNDASQGVAPEKYAESVTRIADRLDRAKAQLMILTTTAVRASVKEGADSHPALQRIAQFNAFVRQFAKQRGYRFGEIYQPMVEAAKPGLDLWEADGGHLNFAGYRVVARGVLDGFGLKDVPVPEVMDVQPARGLVRSWRVKALPDNAPRLTAEQVAALNPDETWATVRLPLGKPEEGWWWDQERRRGFALKVERFTGGGKSFAAVASVESAERREMIVNLGAYVNTVWLNGRQVWKHPPDVVSGWRAGKFRIPMALEKGTNQVVIETGNAFWLTITEDDNW